MQITVRLYRQHDMDLIGLYLTPGFKFTTEMKNALIAHVKGNDYRISAPTTPSGYKGYLKRSIMVHLSIDRNDYHDVYKVLEALKDGQRNAYIKTIMRMSIDRMPLFSYMSGDGITMNRSTAEDVNEKPKEKPAATPKPKTSKTTKPVQQTQKTVEPLPDPEPDNSTKETTPVIQAERPATSGLTNPLAPNPQQAPAEEAENQSELNDMLAMLAR